MNHIPAGASVSWVDYVDATPFRKLGHQHDRSAASVYAHVRREMEALPPNTDISKTACDPKNWSCILNLDGKYVRALSFKPSPTKTIPFPYGSGFFENSARDPALASTNAFFSSSKP